VFDILDVAELCIDLLKFPFRRILALSAAVNSFASGGAVDGHGGHVDVPSPAPLIKMLREAYNLLAAMAERSPSVRATLLPHISFFLSHAGSGLQTRWDVGLLLALALCCVLWSLDKSHCSCAVLATGLLLEGCRGA
jgi:hypothetical protein